jgi:hypothetical protein
MCHIDNEIKQAKKYLMMIQKGVGTTWVPTPSVILWLYTGIIRPFVTWCSSLLWQEWPPNFSKSNAWE